MAAPRRLQISKAGLWYIGLTILLGVSALTSGNNIIYLIESLLLSGMILSGILSERTVSGAHVEIRRVQARAGQTSHDRIYLQNSRNQPLFCVEIGEWRAGKMEPLAFIPRIAPRSTVVVPSNQVLPLRGKHQWEGVAIATSFPFGFARKIRILEQPGERIVWPQSETRDRAPKHADTFSESLRAGVTLIEGEIRPMSQDDDYRLIVWPLSAKGVEPMVRMRRADEQFPELFLDLRGASEPEFETRVRDLAQKLYSKERSGIRPEGGSLTVVDGNAKKRIHGFKNVLNELAVARPSEESLGRSA